MAVRTVLFRSVSLVALLALFFVPFHYWTVDRKGVMRALSPIPAFFASRTIKCSAGSPEWQKELMSFGIWAMRAPASQSAVVDAGGRVHHCEAGWLDNVFFSPIVSENSSFQYGSLTKPITSALIIRLIEQDELDYDDRITELINGKGFHNRDLNLDAVTVGSVMAHRSGVSGEIFVTNTTPWCPYKMDEFFNQNVWVMPEGVHQYSNLGYCILGAVISKTTGMSYRAAIEGAFNLDSYGVEFVDAAHPEGWVYPDYRYHDFYRDDIQPSFDYYSVSSTAGMGGSAKGYARLIHDFLVSTSSDVLTKKENYCDSRKIRNCYGKLFYLYETPSGELYNVKGGHMPGYSSVVVVNKYREVFVWVGNTDTPNASSGVNTTEFINLLSRRGF